VATVNPPTHPAPKHLRNDAKLGSSPNPQGQSVRTKAGKRGLPYISALDGLRAIAILAVMIYHADLPWFPGGFLGVDIFFVLSGFLITSLVLTELERTHRLDFKQFYIRRARRLLPALFLMMAVVLVIGAFLATDAAAGLRRDIPASLFYVTNWAYIFGEQSYFEVIGRPPLLQHLWSLAVEEQFYLIWPAIAYFAFKRGLRHGSGRQKVRQWALIGALLSTAVMVTLSIMGGYPGPNDGSRAYFGTDSHAMGLLIGAALATFWLPQNVQLPIAKSARTVINVAGAGTLALILWIMMGTSSDSAWLYRGGFLIFAIIVAILIVAVSHPSSQVGAVLGKQPFKYIGERSYGLYLWHWPVFLILRPGLDVPLEGLPNLVLRFGVTFALAELSYRYVETPIRNGSAKRKWQQYLAMPLPGRKDITKKLLLIGSSIALVLTVSGFRVVTMPEDSHDYLGGVTETSALDESANADATKPGDPQLSGDVTAPGVDVTRPGVLAIGESVMLGARNGIKDRIKKSTVDASVGRQAGDVLARIKQLKAAGALRDTVVLHTGSNGYVERPALKEMLQELSTAKRLVVVNVSVPRIWQDPNNALISELVEQTPNAVLADWRAVAGDDRSLTVSDGVHLSTSGIQKYGETIKAAISSMEPAQSSPSQPEMTTSES
jgi:peptidoglycan/LPS O-acetylase OafA/YrhL